MANRKSRAPLTSITVSAGRAAFTVAGMAAADGKTAGSRGSAMTLTYRTFRRLPDATLTAGMVFDPNLWMGTQRAGLCGAIWAWACVAAGSLQCRRSPSVTSPTAPAVPKSLNMRVAHTMRQWRRSGSRATVAKGRGAGRIRLPDLPGAPLQMRRCAARAGAAGPVTFAAAPSQTGSLCSRTGAQGFGEVWIQIDLLEKGLARVAISPDRKRMLSELL